MTDKEFDNLQVGDIVIPRMFEMQKILLEEKIEGNNSHPESKYHYRGRNLDDDCSFADGIPEYYDLIHGYKRYKHLKGLYDTEGI